MTGSQVRIPVSQDISWLYVESFHPPIHQKTKIKRELEMVKLELQNDKFPLVTSPEERVSNPIETFE